MLSATEESPEFIHGECQNILYGVQNIFGTVSEFNEEEGRDLMDQKKKYEHAIPRTIKEMKISPEAHKRLMARKTEDGAKNVNEVILKYVPEV
jgi:hypothetical protein